MDPQKKTATPLPQLQGCLLQTVDQPKTDRQRGLPSLQNRRKPEWDWKQALSVQSPRLLASQPGPGTGSLLALLAPVVQRRWGALCVLY